MKKVLFIAHHRLDRSPGQRYRFEQYFDWFRANGIECELSNILNELDDKILYSKGNYLKKFLIAIKAFRKRFNDLKRIKEFDLVIVYREAILTRGIYFERKIAKSGVPMVYDFDDAIWVKDMSEGNKWLSFLKSANKIKDILPLCAHVTAGNDYLADFARNYNSNVSVIPSTINCSKYVPIKNDNKQVVIGWVGSHTTVKHFELVINVYKKLLKKYGSKISFKVIGDPYYSNEELNIQGIAWSNDQEVELFNSIDIGVMPLDEDDWTKGKCGMKGLLYMSVGKPSVMSAVGMNTEIISHGKNGYIPVGEEEWFDVLSMLIEDENLRSQVGESGRNTVLEKYSYESQKYKLLAIYQQLMKIPVTSNNEQLDKKKIEVTPV